MTKVWKSCLDLEKEEVDFCVLQRRIHRKAHKKVTEQFRDIRIVYLLMVEQENSMMLKLMCMFSFGSLAAF